jgi:hypothetical protein
MYKTSLLLGLLGSLLLVSASASADQCPIADIGQACAPADGTGTCISATCTDTASNGTTTTKACGYCVDLPDDYCDPDGGTCSDGGVCNVTGGGAGGGGTTTGASSMVGYSIGSCEAPQANGGECTDCEDASLNVDDAGGQEEDGSTKRGALDSGAPEGARAKDASAASGHAVETGETAGSPSGGGCSVSRGIGANDLGGSLVCAGVLLALRRRRRPTT